MNEGKPILGIQTYRRTIRYPEWITGTLKLSNESARCHALNRICVLQVSKNRRLGSGLVDI